MPQNYSVLVVDLIRSRSYATQERNLIQQQILNTLVFLNRRFQAKLAREVDFSAGDEIQGLFESPAAAYQYYRLFSMCLHPIALRAGIGVGSWDVRIDGKGTTSQDGSAYHHARHAIDHAEQTEGYPVLLFSGKQEDRTINTLLAAAACLTEKQTVCQNQIMLLTELLYPLHEDLGAHTPVEIQIFLQRKAQFDHAIAGPKPLPMDRIQDFPPVPMSAKMEDPSDFYITGGKRRGIPTKLAQLLRLSRQSVEKAIRSGSIYAARNMALTAMESMTAMEQEAAKS